MRGTNSLALQDVRTLLVSCGHKIAEALALQGRALLATEKGPLASSAERLRETERVLADMREWFQENGVPEQDAASAAERSRLLNGLGCVEGMAAAAKRLLDQVERKLDVGVFFSDLAMREAADLFAQSQRQARDVADALATGNPTLRSHVLSWCDNAAHLMNQYTKCHEERLLQGTCSTQGSDIYVALFEAFHEMCYQVRHLALAIPEETDEI